MIHLIEAYLEPSKTSKMECFCENSESFSSSLYLQKIPLVDVRLGSKYTSVLCVHSQRQKYQWYHWPHFGVFILTLRSFFALISCFFSYTSQKMKFSLKDFFREMWPNPTGTADLVTFTEGDVYKTSTRRQRRFQGIIFIGIRMYRVIFKSPLVYL